MTLTQGEFISALASFPRDAQLEYDFAHPLTVGRFLDNFHSSDLHGPASALMVLLEDNERLFSVENVVETTDGTVMVITTPRDEG